MFVFYLFIISEKNIIDIGWKQVIDMVELQIRILSTNIRKNVSLISVYFIHIPWLTIFTLIRFSNKNYNNNSRKKMKS